MSFSDLPTAKQGFVNESNIAKWLIKAKGYSILPVYQIEKSTGKGPQLFSASGEHVAPDMLVFGQERFCFVEAKHKTVFSWYRKHKAWTTGIDLRHYEHYQEVSKITKLPVWLFFYHASEKPRRDDLIHDSCPRECPVGLFGEKLSMLTQNEDHRGPSYDPARPGNLGHGRSGMVYWRHETLRLIATRDEVLNAACPWRVSA